MIGIIRQCLVDFPSIFIILFDSPVFTHSCEGGGTGGKLVREDLDKYHISVRYQRTGFFDQRRLGKTDWKETVLFCVVQTASGSIRHDPALFAI